MTTKQRSLIYTGLPVGVAVLLLLAFFFALPGGVVAAPEAPNAPLWTENFDYGSTADDLTTASGGVWTNHSGTTPYIQYVTTSLSMPGYGSSGVGGSATFSTSGSEDANRIFTEQSSGTVYAASLVNISSASGGNYFLHLMEAGTTNFRARIFAQDNSGNLRFGLSSSSSTASYATTDFNYNTTYLLVVKYNVDTGDSALYVLDAYTASEPVTPLVTSTGTATTISAFAIRQSSGIPSGTVDGIRIATNWEDAVGNSYSGNWIINEIHADPDSTNGDANGDGIAHYSDDEFVEIFNDTGGEVDISGWTLSDGYSVRHIFPSDTAIPNGCAFVVFGGGTPTGDFGNCSVQVASTGSLGLNNSGDTVTLNNGTTDVISYTYGSEAGDNQAITRDPDITGSSFVKHSTATGSGGALFSPGTMIDGTAFSGCPVSPASDLTIDKTGDAIAVAGENLVYEITVSNTNIDPATNVVVTDTLPISTTLVAASSGFTQTNPVAGTYVWELGSVAIDTDVTFNLTVTVDAAVASGTVLTNTASVSTDAAGDQPDNNEVEHTATVYTRTPIYDIQFVPDPGTDDASPYAEQVVMIEGIVYAVYNNGYFVADDAGAWNGVYVYNYNKPNIGDEVRVIGTVKEYYGLTEISYIDSQTVLSSGNALFGPSVVTASEIFYDDVATSEGYEGVFVEIHDIVATSGSDNYNQWTFTDASAGTGKVDDWGYDADPSVGDLFSILRGALVYDFSEYKVLPRDIDDVVPPAALLIEKTAATNVAPSGLLTYTLTVKNITGETLNDLTIVDMVPTTTTLSTVLDGGVSVGGTAAQWDITSLANHASVDVRFVVQAGDYPGQTIVNEIYYASATNWVTQTFGIPVWTFIGDYIPIPAIQGDDFRSPMEGSTVTTQGEVVGFFEGNSSEYNDFDGFFIQDPTGDGNPATSDGIFVNHKSLAISVNLGDLVEVTGMVDEFSEYDGTACYGNECLTQISVSNPSDVITLPTTLAPQAISAIELNPPGDPTASDIYFEALECMLVTLPSTSTVVGPTSYGAVHAVRGDLGIDRVMRTGPYEGMPVAVRHWEKYGDINSADAPNLITGSIIANVDGPLNFSYGDYMVITQDGAEWTVETATTPPATEPSWPAANAIEFSVATFNTYNFDSGDSAPKQTKVVNAIAELNGAAFVALQEIEGDYAEFMTGLIADLATAGYNYDYAASHTDIGGHGVALLWNTDVVTDTSWSADYQDCSPYGSSSSSYDPLWDTCRAQDEYPLFSRRPVVVTGTLSLANGDLEVVVIANHFKSKLGGASADARRLAQGTFVNELAADFIANGSTNVIVLGDLNDFEDAPPLQALTANGTLVNAWDTYAGDDAYSYIYEGVSQILDHILVSQNLYHMLVDMGALHMNADFPYEPYSSDDSVIWRVSDHDLVAATLRLSYRIHLPLIFNSGN